MTMPPKGLQASFIRINGKEFGKSIDCIEQIETSELKECESCNLGKNSGFEISFDMDTQVAQKLYAELQPKHGKKIMVETSCVCDGTLSFAIQLMQALKRMGATNIKIRNEEVENPNPAWMKTRFIANGIVWNTNNYRKMHGIPIRRKCR